MKKLAIAFIWNQHQPFYQDTEREEYIMPWARLHAIKDYYSMAALLESFPAIRQTFNLTPSLLEQIEHYLSGSRDYYQQVLKPAEQLSSVEKRFLLHHYFDIHWEKVIGLYPRYRELLELQGRVREPGEIEAATRRFKARDYQDLMVWFNLCWIDPLIRRENPYLQELEEKGEDFSPEDCRRLLAEQLDILRRIVPVHRSLQEKGQVEVITTPFYHPILPLIIDNHSALRACPELPLPQRFQWPADASIQTELSVHQYRRLFNCPPRGIWPSEQAVSPESIPIFTEQGFHWTVSDEQILARSLKQEINRDGYGHVLNGDTLYRPYLVKGAGQEMVMVFRDHYLSNRIGFEYQHFRPEDAAADLVHRLHKIAENLDWSGEEHLVTISLDGENAWEWYTGDKGPFLTDLYRRLSEDRVLETVTVSDYLAKNPPRRQINELFTGSWVDHSLTRWIGTENKNRLWNYLLQAREMVESYSQEPDHDQKKLERALRNIYIAEGSDYPWWIDSMPYHLASPFEILFRQHLVNVYHAIGTSPPEHLKRPILPVQKEESPIYSPAGPVSMVPNSE